MKSKRKSRQLVPRDYVFSPFSVCHALIQDAVHRCKDSDDATRITVTTTDTADGAYRVSVADTGYGMSERMLEEFFPHHIRGGTRDFSLADIHWDGCLLITTTCLSEPSVRDYSIKLGHKAINQKIAETRPQPKRRAYRGTECSIIVKGNVRALQHFILDICKKITILNFQNVFVEVCEELYGDHGEQESRCVTICDGLNTVAETAQGLDRLRTGFEDYTRKHVLNCTGESKHEGVPGWYIKIGKTQAAAAEISRRAHLTIQACVLLVIDADEDAGSCQTERDMQTQVIYFHNHSYILKSPTMLLRALGKVDWPSIGFQLKTVCESQGGTTPTVIQWYQYPQKIRRLDLVLRNLSDCREDTTWKSGLHVVTKAINAALMGLKAKAPELLCTQQESQVRGSIPHLADCISGIITSSVSKDFQHECGRILGLSPAKLSTVREVLQTKLLAVVKAQPPEIEEDLEEAPDLADEPKAYDSDLEAGDIWKYL